jgi:VCBS repeat-containing protein
VTDKFLVQPKVEIDAPVIITESTTATGAIRELADTTSSTAIDSVSGTIAFKDVDLNDAHTVGQSAPTFEWSGGTLSEDQKAALTEANTLTLTETDSSGTGFGSVAWTHSAADGAFDFLAKGETLTVQYNVTVDDGHGGPAASQAVTITITGANDAPAVSAAITSTASEDAAPYSVNLLTGASDPDSSDVLHVDANSVSGLAAGVTLNGDSLSVDPNAYDHLAVGEHATVTVKYNVIDGNGGAVAQSATITITSANDAPAVSAAITSTASEDAAPYSVNLLTGASDPDSSDVLHVDANSVSGLAAGVTLNGDSLSVDPNAYDHLAVGEHATVTVKYNVIDGNGGAVAQSATITITGANDAPAVSAAIPMRQTTASWRTLRTAPPSASRRTQPIPTKETPSPISSPAIRTIYSRLMPIPAS